MSFSDEYKAGYEGTSGGHGIDPFSYSYQMGQKDRERQLREGTYGTGGGSGLAGSAGVGGMAAAIAVIAAFCAFVIALISYPLAAGVTGIVFGIVAALINSGGNHMNGVGLVFALMVPCFIVYLFMFRFEKTLGRNRAYQMFRQLWRIVVGTFFIHTLTGSLHSEGSNPGFLEYAIDAIATASAPFLMYLNSLRLDRKYDLEPLRFRWLEALMAPVKDRLVPRVDEHVTDTPVLEAGDALRGGSLPLQIAAGQVRLGDTTVPIGQVKSVSYERERTGLLIAAGILLPFVLIPIIGKSTDGSFSGFVPQLLGLASLLFGALLVLWGAAPGMPPGRLQGPFRIVNIFFAVDDTQNGQVYLRFRRPAEERLFMQALENGLAALRSAAPAVAATSVTPRPPAGMFGRLRAAFRF